MASKKLKKAIMAGLAGYAGAKMLGQKKEMAEYLKTEGGDKAKVNYITKKTKPKSMFQKIINMGPGKNATSKKGGTLAGDYGNAFSDEYGFQKGAKTGKMIKARGGKLVNLKPTKLY